MNFSHNFKLSFKRIYNIGYDIKLFSPTDGSNWINAQRKNWECYITLTRLLCTAPVESLTSDLLVVQGLAKHESTLILYSD